MAPFDISHTSSYWCSIVTMSILYHFQDKEVRYWSKTAFIPTMHSMPLSKGSSFAYCHEGWYRKTRIITFNVAIWL